HEPPPRWVPNTCLLGTCWCIVLNRRVRPSRQRPRGTRGCVNRRRAAYGNRRNTRGKRRGRQLDLSPTAPRACAREGPARRETEGGRAVLDTAPLGADLRRTIALQLFQLLPQLLLASQHVPQRTLQ